jgi:CubicO group peptidase (beta-lactamase class C family)
MNWASKRPVYVRQSTRLRAAHTRCAAVAVLFWAAGSLGLDSRREHSTRSRVEAEVSRFMAATRVPGLAVAVVEKGQVSWASGYGRADLENDVPATGHTLFRLASVSKPLTAVAALRRWE